MELVFASTLLKFPEESMHAMPSDAGPAAAKLPEGTFSCHSFRATTATDLLRHDMPRDQVQYLLGHSDARMTDPYNRTNKDISRNVVGRISV
jgi:integrase